MRILEDKAIPASVIKITVGVSCDICGRESKHPSYSDESIWTDSSYAVNGVTIVVQVKHAIGSSYPEGASMEVFAPDICPDCFTEKVLPALRALGVKTEYKDRSY